ncbi:XRE family transcriptional regulator [Opitutaceae bacterium TAV4]|nr:XRE family transcriptional regulator [Opitutaceae bacterium TAV4]RRK01717.1 XRE family transcriptional regulator [Opitutaceae bacterium TAV3]
MILINTIADRLRELRVRHGLTQEEAAELVGVNMRFYQLLESGRKKQMWLETVERLAASYGMEPWQLIGPKLPVVTKPQGNVVKSSIHYRRVRKGPYRKTDSEKKTT